MPQQKNSLFYGGSIEHMITDLFQKHHLPGHNQVAGLQSIEANSSGDHVVSGGTNTGHHLHREPWLRDRKPIMCRPSARPAVGHLGRRHLPAHAGSPQTSNLSCVPPPSPKSAHSSVPTSLPLKALAAPPCNFASESLVITNPPPPNMLIYATRPGFIGGQKLSESSGFRYLETSKYLKRTHLEKACMRGGSHPKTLDHCTNLIVDAQGDPVQTPSGTNPFGGRINERGISI